MKRRYPGDSVGPQVPGGFPGRRPNDPRYRPFAGGDMGPPRGPRAPSGGHPPPPPPPPPRRAGPRHPQNGGGFHGRGAGGYASRGGPGPSVPQGRGPPIFRVGPQRGSGVQGMGRGPPMTGRGNIMGRGNGMAGRGPVQGRPPPPPPPMMGRGPPRQGLPNHFSSVPPPPPPPRGTLGHPPLGAPRAPFQSTLVPPPPAQNPHGGIGPPFGQNSKQQIQQRYPQVSTPRLPAGSNPPIGGLNPIFHPHTGVQQIQVHQGAPSYTSSASIANASAFPHAVIPNGSRQTTSVLSESNHPVASKPTAQQIDEAWKEYTAPNGMKYYHNAILKESTYTKPITLTKKESTMDSQDSRNRRWQEYEDTTTGKKYYSDGVTTTWEKPDDFDSDPQESSGDEDKAGRKKETRLPGGSSFSSKAEAIAAFKGLLLEKGIVPTIKWGEVVKMVSSDTRWAVCEDSLTIGERRQALAEYQTKRANDLKDLERKERIRAKDAFGQLLTDTLPTISEFSVFGSRFADVRSVLAKDDRFHAVPTEEMRETLFLDFCEELRKRDEQKKRNKRREVHDAFVSFLHENEEAGNLTVASTWDSFFSSLNEDAIKDSRFVVSATMSDSDRQLYFADFVIELQEAEDEKRRRIHDARRRAEKAQRDAYRKVLQKLAAERKITPSTRWRSVEELVSMDETFNLVEAQDRDSPRSLFEEFVGEWDDIYHHDRSFLSRLIHSCRRKESDIGSDSTYEDFTKWLLELASESQELYAETRQIIYTEEPLSSARLYYDELISRASDLSRRDLQKRAEDSSEDEGEIVEDGDFVDVAKDEDNDSGPPSEAVSEIATNSY